MAHQITISWNTEAGATSYNIYRGTALGNESPIPYASITAPITTFTDTNVFQGKVYSYEVTSVINGVESADSLQVLAPAIPFPVSPANLESVLDGAGSFEVLAGSTVTSTGNTQVAGDVGVFPGTSITGFPPGVISGVFHAGDFVAQAGQSSLTAAFNDAMSRPTSGSIPADIGGMTLKTGVWDAPSSLAVTGTLTVDAEGNPAAVFILRTPSTLTTASNNSTINLVNGAQESNVYWIVGSSATLGTNTAFTGSILAQTSITVVSGATVVGRLLARTGAVTLDTNIVDAFVILGYVTPGASCIHAVPLLGDLVVIGPLPPSPPNVPPAPPAAPTGLVITSEN
jgi:hypothetical protein